MTGDSGGLMLHLQNATEARRALHETGSTETLERLERCLTEDRGRAVLERRS